MKLFLWIHNAQVSLQSWIKAWTFTSRAVMNNHRIFSVLQCLTLFKRLLKLKVYYGEKTRWFKRCKAVMTPDFPSKISWTFKMWGPPVGEQIASCELTRLKTSDFILCRSCGLIWGVELKLHPSILKVFFFISFFKVHLKFFPFWHVPFSFLLNQQYL